MRLIITRTAIMLIHCLTHSHRQTEMRAETKINASIHVSYKNTHSQDKFWYSRVLTGWHSSSQHHTCRKKGKRARLNALGSNGGWQELSWEHDRDYRLSRSVVGPSSLSPTISPEASFPSIAGSQASTIKLTPNGLIGRCTYDCESTCAYACEKETAKNTVLVSE